MMVAEMVRQVTIAAVLQFRGDAEWRWYADDDQRAWAAREDIRAANQALGQLRYGWLNQDAVWG